MWTQPPILAVSSFGKDKFKVSTLSAEDSYVCFNNHFKGWFNEAFDGF